jgi:hypothetical protein
VWPDARVSYRGRQDFKFRASVFAVGVGEDLEVATALHSELLPVLLPTGLSAVPPHPDAPSLREQLRSFREARVACAAAR